MKVDITGFRDKASKNQQELDLYLKADTFIEAYALHTDLRVERDGPALAIGGEWEEHGKLQLKLLQSHGFRKDDKLLDFGCGTGRFARIVVPFLEPHRYFGMDISSKAIEHCEQLAKTEGWDAKKPEFYLTNGGLQAVTHLRFDFIWAHSVFTHLPTELIEDFFRQLGKMSFGTFLFTHKLAAQPQRSGLKQFQYPPSFFETIAAANGLKAKPLTEKIRGQSLMLCWRP